MNRAEAIIKLAKIRAEEKTEKRRRERSIEHSLATLAEGATIEPIVPGSWFVKCPDGQIVNVSQIAKIKQGEDKKKIQINYMSGLIQVLPDEHGRIFSFFEAIAQDIEQ